MCFVHGLVFMIYICSYHFVSAKLISLNKVVNMMNSSTHMSKLDPQISLKHHFSQQFMKDFQYNTLISENMCFLDQIEINISFLAIIISPKRLFLANALQSCISEDIFTACTRSELTIVYDLEIF